MFSSKMKDTQRLLKFQSLGNDKMSMVANLPITKLSVKKKERRELVWTDAEKFFFLLLDRRINYWVP